MFSTRYTLDVIPIVEGSNTTPSTDMSAGLVLGNDFSSITFSSYAQQSGTSTAPSIYAMSRKNGTVILLSLAEYIGKTFSVDMYDMYILPAYNGARYTFTFSANK